MITSPTDLRHTMKMHSNNGSWLQDTFFSFIRCGGENKRQSSFSSHSRITTCCSWIDDKGLIALIRFEFSSLPHGHKFLIEEPRLGITIPQHISCVESPQFVDALFCSWFTLLPAGLLPATLQQFVIWIVQFTDKHCIYSAKRLRKNIFSSILKCRKLTP